MSFDNNVTWAVIVGVIALVWQIFLKDIVESRRRYKLIYRTYVQEAMEIGAKIEDPNSSPSDLLTLFDELDRISRKLRDESWGLLSMWGLFLAPSAYADINWCTNTIRHAVPSWLARNSGCNMNINGFQNKDYQTAYQLIDDIIVVSAFKARFILSKYRYERYKNGKS